LAKKDSKVLPPVAILLRVLFPNEGVRGDREEIIEILGSKRPEFKEVALRVGANITSTLMSYIFHNFSFSARRP